jgi:uncharacterized protein YggU (UPF0235/DUF167 family)
MRSMEIRAAGELVLVSARVRPRSRPGLERTEQGLVIRVAAAPVGGMATDEARASLAAALEVPKSAVAFRAGARSRSKVFAVSGLTVDEARARLQAAVS